MDVLEEKIKNLQNFRDLYFINNPTISNEQFLKELKNQVSKLREEIPISIKDAKNVKATNYYIQGKILNIMPEYDGNCENYLTKAIKKECTKWEFWLELAICMWKKGDPEGALECMKEAYKLNNNDCNVLTEYGTVLRNQRKPELNELGREICCRGISLYPTNSMIWYSYANQCLHDFYNYGKDMENLEHSIESFKKSLSFSSSTSPLPSDFFLNFSSSLYSIGNLVECCLNLTKAVILEPHYQAIQEKISFINNLLGKIFEKSKDILHDDVTKDVLTNNSSCKNKTSEDNENLTVTLKYLLNTLNNSSSYYLGSIEEKEKTIVICDAKNLLIIDISMKNSIKKELLTGDDNNIIYDIKLPMSCLISKNEDSFNEICQKQKDHLFDEMLLLKRGKELFPNIHLLDYINIFCYH